VTPGEPPSVPVLYPNPNNGNPPDESVYLPGITGTEKVSLRIYTIAFRMVQDEQETVESSHPVVTFELKDKDNVELSNGLYYVVVTVNGNKTVLKLLVLH
jgi:hypothetical protein